MDSEYDEEERKHFQRIILAFRNYRSSSLQRIQRIEKFVARLSGSHQKLLETYRKHLDVMKSSIEANNQIIKLIIKDVGSIFDNKSSVNPDTSMSRTDLADQEKVQSVIKQFVRDWSTEGEEERRMCYQPIIEEIINLYPAGQCNTKDIKVLVPGAGLGRLAYEIARKGYSCQGNEFSLFMLFAANFILNKSKGVNSYKIHPWVHHHLNNLYAADQVREVLFPDVNPGDHPPNSDFSMAAGDFLEVYQEENIWDCVATCFFIDCANNILAFIETIYKILKPGGTWINLGPLLYHYSDMPNEDSIEPSYDQIREIIKGFGFDMQKEELNVKTRYSQNVNSILQYEYNSVYFVCKKPIDFDSGLSDSVSNGDAVN